MKSSLEAIGLIDKNSSLGGLSGVRNGIQIDTDLLGEFWLQAQVQAENLQHLDYLWSNSPI